MLACLAALVGYAFAWPDEAWRGYYDDGYLSKFARSGVTAVSDFINYGFMESDAVVAERLKCRWMNACHPAGQPPHIIMVHDESSFDIRQAPGVKVPPGYGSHFKSFDGKARRFLAESVAGRAGSPNTMCSPGCRRARSAAFPISSPASPPGRVERGLPMALRRCGYRRSRSIRPTAPS